MRAITSNDRAREASPSRAPSAAAASIFALIDNAPMNARHYFYWLLASGGAFPRRFLGRVTRIAEPLLRSDFTITPTLIGLIGLALVLGAVAGAALGGMAADRFGRKRVFLLDMSIVAVGALLCTLASTPVMIAAGQFIIGFGIGVDFPTSGSYVSEILPKAARSRMTVATISLQSVGMVAAALTGMAVLHAHPANADWRLLLGSGAVLALVIVVGRLAFPESPRWLADKSRMREALGVLSTLAGRPVAGRIESAAEAEPAGRATSAGSGGLAILFSPEYRTRTLLVSLPWLFMDVATYGVGLFTPVILVATISNPPARARWPLFSPTPREAESAMCFSCSASWPLFGPCRVSAGFPMQVAGFAGMGLGMLLLMLATLAADGPEIHLALVIGGFVLFNFAMNIGPNATTFTLAPHLFPTGIRASASGFAAASAKVGATFGPSIVPQLQTPGASRCAHADDGGEPCRPDRNRSAGESNAQRGRNRGNAATCSPETGGEITRRRLFLERIRRPPPRRPLAPPLIGVVERGLQDRSAGAFHGVKNLVRCHLLEEDKQGRSPAVCWPKRPLCSN